MSAEYVGPCWDCGDEYPVAKMSEHRVHDWDTDGPGYETYRAPLCPNCARKRQPRYPCDDCGREWPDVEGAATCCDWKPEGRPMPDGGVPDECQLCRPLDYRGDQINEPEGMVEVARDDGGTKIVHCCRRCSDELFTDAGFAPYTTEINR